MKGYKHTELGWIPEDWEKYTLGNLGTFSKGKGITKEELSETGLPCIRYGEIYTTHDYVIKKFLSHISTAVARESRLIQNGDILFAGSGETLEDIGKAVAYIDNEEAYAGGDVIILSTNNKVNPVYLSYLLNTESINEQKRKLGQGHSVVHIYSSGLANIKLSLPSYTEQTKIAAVITTWDRAIDTLTELINKKQELKKGLMQELLRGEKRLRGYKGDWQTKKIKDIGKVNLTTVKEDTEHDYSFYYVDLSCVKEGQIELPKEKTPFSLASSRARRVFHNNDILMATVRPNLKGFSLVNFDTDGMICSTGFAVIKTNSPEDAQFLYQNLYSSYLQNQISELITGSSYPAINSSDVENLTIKYPENKSMRQFISNILSKADGEMQLLQKQLAYYKEQKKGLMRVLLTGKKRVRPLPASPKER